MKRWLPLAYCEFSVFLTWYWEEPFLIERSGHKCQVIVIKLFSKKITSRYKELNLTWAIVKSYTNHLLFIRIWRYGKSWRKFEEFSRRIRMKSTWFFRILISPDQPGILWVESTRWMLAVTPDFSRSGCLWLFFTGNSE